MKEDQREPARSATCSSKPAAAQRCACARERAARSSRGVGDRLAGRSAPPARRRAPRAGRGTAAPRRRRSRPARRRRPAASGRPGGSARARAPRLARGRSRRPAARPSASSSAATSAPRRRCATETRASAGGLGRQRQPRPARRRARRRSRRRSRRSRGPRSAARKRHAAHARLGLEGARRGDRGRRLVEGVERAEEQPDLLAGDHHRGAPAASASRLRARAALAGRRPAARAAPRPARGSMRRRAGRARRAAGRPRRALAEVARQERPRASPRRRGRSWRMREPTDEHQYTLPPSNCRPSALAHSMTIGRARDPPLLSRWLSSRCSASRTRRRRAAGPPPQPNAAQIELGLRKLGVAGSVLYVAAHPDDENTALLAYLANGALRARRLPVAHARRRRAEPGRRRAGAGAGPHPHAGAAGRAPHRRRRAVLHARARLRLLEDPRRDAAHLGQGRGPRRRGLGDPPLPPRRDHHALLARAVGHPRPPHGLGDAGAGGVPRRRRPAVSPRAARGRRRRPGRRGGSSGTARRWNMQAGRRSVAAS